MVVAGKPLPLLLLLWCSALLVLSTPAVSATQQYKELTLGGSSYISLHEWSRRWGLSFEWQRQNKIVYVSSKWTKLIFNVPSKKASINGRSLWLCSPILEHRGALYISEMDVQKTLEPILSPPKLPKGDRIRTIAIAPGHGGKDPGNMVNQHQEKTYTLALAKTLKQELIARGFKVVMTRESDQFIDLAPQAAIARKAGADLFVSVHYNAVADVDPKGVETFALTPAGAISTNGGTPSRRSPGNKYDSHNLLLAYQVHRSVLQKTNFEDRGIRRAQFMVLRELHMPGILFEGGFMSNPSDAKKIFSAAHRKIVARAIADGIVNFKNLVERK
jgi:N-acetylmuramoyl-L-alanine amidase